MRKKEKTVRTRQRGSKWYYSFDAGEVDGKRKQVSRGGFATEQEAMEAGMEAYTSWRHGNISITSERISVRDYLAKWLEEVMRQEVKRGSHRQYRNCIARIIPRIGSKALQELRPRDIDAMLRSLAASGLASNTIRATKAMLSAALNYAVYPAELIQSNPCLAVKLPKGTPRHVTSRTVITDEKMREILAKFPPGHKYRVPCVICLHTGMRIGEALGLEWGDIDLEKGSIAVCRQMQEFHGEGESSIYFETPKTSASARMLYMDGALIAELRRWKAMQAENRIRMGDAYQIIYEQQDGRWAFTLPQSEPCPDGAVPHGLVCTDGLGLPVKYSALCQALHALGVNSHSFRHTHATVLIEGGASAIDAAARLGHADAGMVNKVYAHDTEEMMRETVRILDKKYVRYK